MPTFNPMVPFSISQIEATFNSQIGNTPRTILGTGFFVSSLTKGLVFVTNKHNLDPTLKLGAGTDYSLSSINIQLREYNRTAFTSNTRFIAVDLTSTQLVHSASSDVSLIVNPQFINRPTEYMSYNLLQAALADQTFLGSKVMPMDLISFWGFPGTVGQQWWDTIWNAPIARMASISSWPHRSFTNPSIATDDVTLVSGLSFAGSSGSPVFIHEKGIPPGGDLVDPNYVPPKIIGIMSGHWWDQQQSPEMFRHSGLSYYTRSTSILELLNI